MPLQNVSDGAAGNVVSQIGPRALDAPMAPIAVLVCPKKQQFNLERRSARS
jgi:hypothetical protein